MTTSHPDPDPRWEAGFEGHERAQAARRAQLTLSEKLDWLEQAHRLVLELEIARRSSARRGSLAE